MARRNPNRAQITRRAIQARSVRSGGTTAPRSAARGARTGLSRNRPARPKLRAGLGPAKPAPAGHPGSGGGQGPGAAGAAKAGPYSPAPWDSRYESIVAGAQKSYLTGQGDLNAAERSVKQDFGLENDYAANPYSRAALLQENFQRANRGTTNSAGLQLYSGSTGNHLAANRESYGQSRDQLERSYREALGQINEKRVQEREEREAAEREAEFDRNEKAAEADLEPEAAPQGGGGGNKRRRRKRRGSGGGQKKAAVGRARVAR